MEYVPVTTFERYTLRTLGRIQDMLWVSDKMARMFRKDAVHDLVMDRPVSALIDMRWSLAYEADARDYAALWHDMTAYLHAEISDVSDWELETKDDTNSDGFHQERRGIERPWNQ